VTPLVYAIPVQLIAYHTAVIMGHRRGSAPQSGEIRDRGVGARSCKTSFIGALKESERKARLGGNPRRSDVVLFIAP
jgi:hypothetical protein